MAMPFLPEILKVAEMRLAEQAAAAASSGPLMENAGQAVAKIIAGRWSPRSTVVLCGTGGNGGDGYVAARCLKEAGWPVRVAIAGEPAGAAAAAALRWSGSRESLSPACLDGAELVIDALFGLGFEGELGGAERAVVEAINAKGIPCIAIDLPSGVSADRGEVPGIAPRCMLTITFFRKKPAHLLLPAADCCGEVMVEGIGIPESCLENIAPKTAENAPELWLDMFPWPGNVTHKHDRGHALVLGGLVKTGAARLAAQAAARAGAGLVTIACPESMFAVYAGGAPHLLVAPMAGESALGELLAEKVRNVALLGPGGGISKELGRHILTTLDSPLDNVVLDADALTAMAEDDSLRQEVFRRLAERVLLTPHLNEFCRLFRFSPEEVARDKLGVARKAAASSGCTILLKGADTIIAAPDDWAVISRKASPFLATAGSGDILAGIVLGLVAQGMDMFEAACAATWIHGAAAGRLGPGLVATDLLKEIPYVLRELYAHGKK